MTEYVTLSQNHMNTTFHFKVPFENGTDRRRLESLLIDAHAEVARLETLWSEFIASSEIALLNVTEVGAWMAVSHETSDVLKMGLEIGSQTDDAFSLCAKSSSIEARTSGLELDTKNLRARRLVPDAHLGLGAIGKGAALDRVAVFLERQGVEAAFLSAGGSSLLGWGRPERGRSWTFQWKVLGKVLEGVRGVGMETRELTITDGSRMGVGISGTDEQGAHIIEKSTSPHTSRRGEKRGAGNGTSPRTLSSMVGHPLAAKADALSTARFLAPLSRQFADLPQAFLEESADSEDRAEPLRLSWNSAFEEAFLRG